MSGGVQSLIPAGCRQVSGRHTAAWPRMRLASSISARVNSVVGTNDKLEALLELLQPPGILEVVRTGTIAMARGKG